MTNHSRVLSNEVNQQVDKKVLLRGWAQTIRLHSKVAFIDLRDRKGITQLVITDALLNDVQNLTPESVISVEGVVTKRPQNLVNPNIISGTVEVQVDKLTVEAVAKPLPLPLNDREVGEDVRLKYRYLDLRSTKMAENLRTRHRMNQFIRDFFTNKDFIEVETPYISKSTPEGARDYLVPSRIMPGNFYALPQSPQQYKQLLMVAGAERYFQIVRCFRDEDARADRQPEFSQLDVELSFSSQEEILELLEDAYKDLVKTLFPEKSLTFAAFPRLKYAEVMKQYGTDRPDLRKDKNNPDELAFAFIVDFPMFEYKEGDKRWGAVHHPFTAPAAEWEDKFEKDPKNAFAEQYDLVLNGSEVAGGSIRIHKPEVLQRVFEFLGHSKDEITAKFGHLIEAFQYGVPPHGGFASGLDRLYAILLKEDSIRDVIAFAKAGDGRDLMMNAPSPIDESQLKELGLKRADAK
ncbi:MAG: aspartate--tRNA ligase [Candidatus Berkelbacteria bacterium]|nr:MAG: aspartate--tRNA ligase [Candidatus Berkelbacteria bacterium]QQG52128.1 MAG: aspartate--tRNA ligase [Candidatus Berkelbacteria bacterium]